MEQRKQEEVLSLVDLKKSIPVHLFKVNLWKAFYYVFRDLFFVAVCYGSMIFLEKMFPYPSFFLLFVVYPLYCFFQGLFMWAIFVLGHDCGHGSFSNKKWVNDCVGTFLHSIILVPYHPWRLSHRHHHTYTGNYEKDEIFYPVVKEQQSGLPFLVKVPSFGFGFSFLGYLIFGYEPRPVYHFHLLDPLFYGHNFEVVSSLVCHSLVVYGLYLYWASYGWLALVFHYVIPWLVFASWLVITTFLHHMEPGLPWFSNQKWNSVKGRLSSIDRDYGIFHNLTHSIGTHQVHHLFTQIPHYNLEEATKHFRAKYPELVRKSQDPILPAFLRNSAIFTRQFIMSEPVDEFVFTKE